MTIDVDEFLRNLFSFKAGFISGLYNIMIIFGG